MKHIQLAAITLATCLCAGQAMGQVTSYIFTAPPYTVLSPSPNCTVGDCTAYTTSHRATITLTFAAPLAPNLPKGDRAADVIAYSASDGLRSTSGPGPNAFIFPRFGTDAYGMPTDYEISIYRTAGPPYLEDMPESPYARTGVVFFHPQLAVVTNNYHCEIRGLSRNPEKEPGYCQANVRDASSSDAQSYGPILVTMTPPRVPTLTEWALIMLGGLLSGSAVLILLRRRSITPNA